MKHSIALLQQWITEEEKRGSPNPNRMLLATCSPEGIPHSRVVAIREILEDGIIFFTQSGTQKVKDLSHSPHASMTLWLAQQQRQVSMNGNVKELSAKQNEDYWSTLPRERQLSFYTYAPTSGQAISSLQELECKQKEIETQFLDSRIPMSPYYVGYCFKPFHFTFYTLGSTSFSEIYSHQIIDGNWQILLISP